MTHQRYAGRVPLVTGAGSGIGQATVLRLAEEGAIIVGCDIDAAGLTATGKLLAADGHDAELLTADVTVQADIDRVVAALQGAPVDLLANVAGTAYTSAKHGLIGLTNLVAWLGSTEASNINGAVITADGGWMS